MSQTERDSPGEADAVPVAASESGTPPPFAELGPGLLHQLARTFWAFKQAYAAELGISTVELGILTCLGTADGATQQELTARLRVDPSMITRTVKVLEREQGLITRARDERDNRLMRVYLTEAGRQRLRGLPERAGALEQRLMRALSAAEREQLGQFLRQIEQSLQQRPPGDT